MQKMTKLNTLSVAECYTRRCVEIFTPDLHFTYLFTFSTDIIHIFLTPKHVTLFPSLPFICTESPRCPLSLLRLSITSLSQHPTWHTQHPLRSILTFDPLSCSQASVLLLAPPPPRPLAASLNIHLTLKHQHPNNCRVDKERKPETLDICICEWEVCWSFSIYFLTCDRIDLLAWLHLSNILFSLQKLNLPADNFFHSK